MREEHTIHAPGLDTAPNWNGVDEVVLDNTHTFYLWWHVILLCYLVYLVYSPSPCFFLWLVFQLPSLPLLSSLLVGFILCAHKRLFGGLSLLMFLFSSSYKCMLWLCVCHALCLPTPEGSLFTRTHTFAQPFPLLSESDGKTFPTWEEEEEEQTPMPGWGGQMTSLCCFATGKLSFHCLPTASPKCGRRLLTCLLPWKEWHAYLDLLPTLYPSKSIFLSRKHFTHTHFVPPPPPEEERRDSLHAFAFPPPETGPSSSPLSTCLPYQMA